MSRQQADQVALARDGVDKPDCFVQRNVNPVKRWDHNTRCLWEASCSFHQPTHRWPWPWYGVVARFVR